MISPPPSGEINMPRDGFPLRSRGTPDAFTPPRGGQFPSVLLNCTDNPPRYKTPYDLSYTPHHKEILLNFINPSIFFMRGGGAVSIADPNLRDQSFSIYVGGMGFWSPGSGVLDSGW